MVVVDTVAERYTIFNGNGKTDVTRGAAGARLSDAEAQAGAVGFGGRPVPRP